MNSDWKKNGRKLGKKSNLGINLFIFQYWREELERCP